MSHGQAHAAGGGQYPRQAFPCLLISVFHLHVPAFPPAGRRDVPRVCTRTNIHVYAGGGGNMRKPPERLSFGRFFRG